MHCLFPKRNYGKKYFDEFLINYTMADGWLPALKLNELFFWDWGLGAGTTVRITPPPPPSPTSHPLPHPPCNPCRLKGGEMWDNNYNPSPPPFYPWLPDKCCLLVPRLQLSYIVDNGGLMGDCWPVALSEPRSAPPPCSHQLWCFTTHRTLWVPTV